MSEQRFTFDYEVEFEIFDRVTKKHYDGRVCCQEKICDLLNEQQSDLNYLARFIGEFKVDEFKEKLRTLRTLEDKVDEQQATIRKLQDLCGKSDGENMKLRIENKRLEKEVNLLRPTNIEQYEQIQKLQEENEKLRKELGDCEKFRYTVFKRLNDEHIKECSMQ